MVNASAAGPLPVVKLTVWIVDKFSIKTSTGSETQLSNKRGLCSA